MREAIIFCFNLKKTVAETFRMLQEAYGERCLSETACKMWFWRFNNVDFSVEDKQRPGQSKQFEDEE